MTKSTDTGRREAFAARMTDILNASALGVAMSLGYRAGLFDAMDQLGEPAGSARIAGKAGLDERYVREWLAVMACGGVVELSQGQSGKDLFRLPPEHGDLLAKRAGSDNLGVYTLEMPLLVQCALDDVFEGFRTGEGVPYDRYPRFQDWMGQVAEAKHRRVLVEHFLPSVAEGELVRRLKRGMKVLDVGCSEGLAVLLMARAYPESEFVGVDISGEAVEAARAEADRLRLSNASFDVRDAAALAEDVAWSGSFGYVTAFDAIHDQTRPAQVLEGIRTVLADGGMFSMVDIKAETPLAGNMSHPLGTFLYAVSLMHCMPVALVDGGAGLGTMWGRQKALAMLGDAGFSRVDVCDMPFDSFNTHYLCRKA